MSKFKIVIINGPATSGKDTFCNQCKQIMRHRSDGVVYTVSTVDRIKSIAENEFGWDGHKNAKSRQFLSDFKDLLTKYDDLPFKWTCSTIKQIYQLNTSLNRNVAVFVHCREPDEIDKFVNYYGKDNVETLLIDRNVHEKFKNHADSGVYDYFYDCKIENNKALDELYKSAIRYLEYIFETRMENDDE